jgi:hypothetical protein
VRRDYIATGSDDGNSRHLGVPDLSFYYHVLVKSERKNALRIWRSSFQFAIDEFDAISGVTQLYY